MENENTSELQAQNEAENANSTNEETQTSEAATSEAGASGDGAKQEESVYAMQLKEIEEREQTALKRAEEAEAKLEKEKEVNERKEKTIQSLKKTKVDADPDLEERILSRVRAEQEGEKVAQMVRGFSSDLDEQKLILKHYHSSIVKSGDVQRDLTNAAAIANSHIVIERKRAEAISAGREEMLASLPSISARGDQPLQYKDPIQKAAEELVAKINPNATKEVAKYFKR